MGCRSSKSCLAIVGGGGGSGGAAQSEAELSSYYKEACRLLPELRPFIITAAAANTQPHSTSITIGDVPELKEVISTNPDLFYFVKEYFKNSVEALKFLAALKRRLAEVRDDQTTIQEALRCFEAEEMDNDVKQKKKKYLATIMKLKTLNAAGDPFLGLFTEEFKLACEQQKAMLKELYVRKGKLDKKLSSVKSWRKAWGIACGVVFAAALVCSVVFAAVAVPHLATASAAAVSIVIKSVEQWFDSLWQGLEKELRDEREVVKKMYTGALFVIQELESIRVFVEQLTNHVRSLSWDAEFTSSNEEVAVKVGVEEIKRKLEEFSKSVDDLGTQVDLCSAEIGRMVPEFLKIIANDI